jgi:hypothetical protein
MIHPSVYSFSLIPMLSAVLSFPQLFGYAAFVLGINTFRQKNDKHFKLYMTGECIAYVIHFFLLGNPSASASALVSAGRSALSLYTRSIWVAIGVIVINVILGASLVEHWWNWLPLAASCIGTLALFLLSGIRMRLVMLIGTALWIVNNLASGSIGGSALEMVIFVVNSHSIREMYRDAKILSGQPIASPSANN